MHQYYQSYKVCFEKFSTFYVNLKNNYVTASTAAFGRGNGTVSKWKKDEKENETLVRNCVRFIQFYILRVSTLSAVI